MTVQKPLIFERSDQKIDSRATEPGFKNLFIFLLIVLGQFSNRSQDPIPFTFYPNFDLKLRGIYGIPTSLICFRRKLSWNWFWAKSLFQV